MSLGSSSLTFHKLEVFCRVVELESVTRAAEHLNVAQPVVTAHLRSLEDKLGVKLTEREGRRLKLSDSGRHVYRWATDVLSRTGQLERELSDSKAGLSGSVSISTSISVGSYILPKRIVALREQHKSGEISLFTATPRSAVRALRDGRADFCISILATGQDLSGLEVTTIGSDELVLMCAASKKIGDSPLTSNDISELPFVAPERHSSRRAIEDAALHELEIDRHNILLEFGTGEALIQAIQTGIGYGFLFKSSIDDQIALKRLRLVKLKKPKIDVPIYLIRSKNKHFAPFQQFIYDHFRNNPL